MGLLSKEAAYSTETRVLAIVFFAFCFILPLSMIKNLHGFRYISLLVVGSLFYTMCVMLA